MDQTARIKQFREAIRYHRDQKGDDRCWVDDYTLWKLLPDTPSEPTSLPPLDEMMKRCGAFYHLRRSETADSVPTDAILDPATWDSDLDKMTELELLAELKRLEDLIRTHRDVQGERTIAHDRQLYLVLPEKLPADFRLPSEENFLGEGRAPKAGCPSFWRSHQNCGTEQHDTHRWGPCSTT